MHGVAEIRVLVEGSRRNRTLKDFIFGYSRAQGLYLMALQRGFKVSDANSLAVSFGLDVNKELVNPEFGEVVEVFKAKRWWNPKEVEEIWLELLSGRYAEIMLLGGIKESLKKPIDRDNKLITEATKIYVAAQTRKKIGKAEPEVSYDELLLRKKRYYKNEQDGTDEHGTGGNGAEDQQHVLSTGDREAQE